MAMNQHLSFVSSSFTLCGHSKFSQVQTTAATLPFLGRPYVIRTCSNSRVRMISDTPSGPTRQDNSDSDSGSVRPKAGEIATDNNVDDSFTIKAEEDPATSNVMSVAGTAAESSTKGGDMLTEGDTNLSGMGIVRGNMEEGIIEEMDDLPAVADGGEDDDMDFTKLMTFDGLKVQKDENGEIIVEELQPPRRYRNLQAMRTTREKFKMHEADTGSPEYQIAALTSRIKYMTEHIREHPKDHASTRGLLKMVSRRTRLLKYLKQQDENRFHNIIRGLDIRVSQQLRRL